MTVVLSGSQTIIAYDNVHGTERCYHCYGQRNGSTLGDCGPGALTVKMKRSAGHPGYEHLPAMERPVETQRVNWKDTSFCQNGIGRKNCFDSMDDILNEIDLNLSEDDDFGQSARRPFDLLRT